MSMKEIPKLIEEKDRLEACEDNYETDIVVDKEIEDIEVRKLNKEGIDIVHLLFKGRNGGHVLLTFDLDEWEAYKERMNAI